MSRDEPIPYDAPLEAYRLRAQALLDALRAGEEAAAWRFKWEHPRFRGRTVADVRAATLDLADAQAVIAHENGWAGWAELAALSEEIRRGGPAARFEQAVEAVVAGDAAALRTLLREHPELTTQRSTRKHRATLLHYTAANGVEGWRQRTPPNALEIAGILLDAGAEVDALADMYEERCTTLSMLLSSEHPAAAGLQALLAELLIDRGAALHGAGSKWQSPVLTALAFGYLQTAEAMARRGAPWDSLPAAAGLGRREEAARLLPHADAPTRHAALALAAQHGHVAVARLLLDAGEDPSRYNPEGLHAHSTPLHQAALAGHADMVRLLVERGAPLDIRDTIYGSTPLGWAIHGGQAAIADYLRGQGAPGG